jgi:hypothetical protein
MWFPLSLDSVVFSCKPWPFTTLTHSKPTPIFALSRASNRYTDKGNALNSNVFKYIVAFVLLIGCGQRDPVVEMQKTLASAPDYTIILDDMQAEGSFFTKYYHKYRVLQGKREMQTDWVEVEEDVYRKYEPFLGMSLVSKSETEGVNASPHPPGYHHVGSATHGYWGGGGFWVWYGQYAMMRSLLGGGMGRNIYRNDYDSYRNTSRQGRPYYGQNRDYGTNGSVTKQTRPGFFKRRQAAQQRRQSSFAQKAKSRVGRGRTGFGGRSGGFGK